MKRYRKRIFISNISRNVSRDYY